ncbi:MAG: HWE histidine kinase domain-containing protein [Cypionkella sp.]
MSQFTDDTSPQMRLRALSAGLQSQGITLLHQDGDGSYDLAENLPPEWPFAQAVGSSAHEVFPADLADRFGETSRICLATGQQQCLDFELEGTSRRRQFQATFIPDLPGITIALRDVTEDRNRDAAVKALLREVSHRSKNLLAIVQSVAMQTAHHSDDIQGFLDRFRGRLHALSSTQDLVTESEWRGTHFQTLVISQLNRVSPTILRDTRITGDNPLLGPNASLHIGLAIHELAANAVVHGALAERQSGRVWVNAMVEKGNDRPDALVIEWQETGIDVSHVRHAPRFGTMVLERIVPLSVGGSASYVIDDDSVTYRLAVPSDQFEP